MTKKFQKIYSKIRDLFHVIGIHDYRIVKDTGLNKYKQCNICAKRKVDSLSGTIVGPFIDGERHGYQPIDTHWLETGEWYEPTPPKGGSVLKKYGVPDKHFEGRDDYR